MDPSTSPPDRTMLRRALFLFTVCGILAFIVLAGQLFRLQILRHTELESAALAQQLRRTALPAGRGTIYDRQGRVLAMSATTYTVYISPAELVMYGEDPELIARELGGILSVEPDRILDLCADRRSWYKTVARQVGEETASTIRAFKAEQDIQSVKLEPGTRRYYPFSDLAAHVIGFVGTENTGLSGVEFTENESLTGQEGSILRLKNSVGTDMLFAGYEDYVDPLPGENVHLTIDAALQYFLEKQLRRAMEDYDIQNGAAGILMDPDTGAILAMASLGGFDLNHYQELSPEAEAEIAGLADPEEASEMRRQEQLRQWRNKAISDTYEPGSTFKILTLAMALEEGIAQEGSPFYCPGSMNVPGRGRPLHCWRHAGHGSQTLTQAVQHSCNVAFATLGLRLGEETFYRYCESFGFFRSQPDETAPLTGKTGIALPGESGSIWWSRKTFCDPENLSQLAAASFGQTFNITPLQLITAVSACCNGGRLMKPHVVDHRTDSAGNVTFRSEPELIRQVISPETSRRVNAILEQVVCDTTHGTGKNAYVAGYRVAGKTGTSEKVARDAAGGSKEYIVSFIGYAPADDPKVVCLVLMDTPSNESGIYISGGQMAAPVVGRILSEALPALGVAPRYTEAERMYMDRSVPSLIGMTLAEAGKVLKEAGFGCVIRGEGSLVADQLPAAGTVVAAGTEVILSAQEETAEETAVVPELRGLAYSEARELLAEAGLFLRSDGTILSGHETVVVADQSVPAGESLPAGTVITVALIDNDENDLGVF